MKHISKPFKAIVFVRGRTYEMNIGDEISLLCELDYFVGDKYITNKRFFLLYDVGTTIIYKSEGPLRIPSLAEWLVKNRRNIQLLLKPARELLHEYMKEGKE